MCQNLQVLMGFAAPSRFGPAAPLHTDRPWPKLAISTCPGKAFVCLLPLAERGLGAEAQSSGKHLAHRVLHPKISLSGCSGDRRLPGASSTGDSPGWRARAWQPGPLLRPTTPARSGAAEGTGAGLAIGHLPGDGDGDRPRLG